MDKKHSDKNQKEVHDFIEVLSQKAEEIKKDYEGVPPSENPLYFLNQLIFPDNDFRSADPEASTPPFFNTFSTSGFNYTGENEEDYCYGFTNSEFLAFVGQLCPLDFLIIMGLITTLIYQPLNFDELTVVFMIFNAISEMLEMLQMQAAFQNDLQQAEQSKAQGQALQQDFNSINQQLCRMQEQINCLQNQLLNKDNPCKSPHTPKPY